MAGMVLIHVHGISIFVYMLCVFLQSVDKKKLEKADAKLKQKQDKRALQDKSGSETKGFVHVQHACHGMCGVLFCVYSKD